MAVLGDNPSSALPRAQPDATPGLVLGQRGPAPVEQPHAVRGTPSADLDEVLRATRAKLEELTEAMALVVTEIERHKEMRALGRDNERLATALAEAKARQTDLEGSRELAQARIAELTRTIDAARQESSRLDEALARLRGQNEQLDERLTRADAAHLASLGKARQTQVEMAKKLKVAEDEVKAAKADLVSRGEELETHRQELADAKGAREQVEARVAAMEKRVERSGAEAQRLRTELADAKAQLAQAAAAAVEAERARQAAHQEADRLRSEAEEARDELKEAMTESARLQIANADLEREILALHRDLQSATATARQSLVMMGKKVEELNAALERARPDTTAPPDDPQTAPDPIEEDRDAAAPSAMAHPPAPAPAGMATSSVAGASAASVEDASLATAKGKLDELIDSLVSDPGSTGDRRADPAGGAAEPAMAAPAAPPPVEPGLTRFHASLQALNALEQNAAGSDLFSGVESADGQEVRVSTTAAWGSLPPIGRESYLDSLLGSWVEARGGKGPAIVQIVDSRGQVLVEKSWP